jgi:hypothetical protein
MERRRATIPPRATIGCRCSTQSPPFAQIPTVLAITTVPRPRWRSRFAPLGPCAALASLSPAVKWSNRLRRTTRGSGSTRSHLTDGLLLCVPCFLCDLENAFSAISSSLIIPRAVACLELNEQQGRLKSAATAVAALEHNCEWRSRSAETRRANLSTESGRVRRQRVGAEAGKTCRVPKPGHRTIT